MSIRKGLVPALELDGHTLIQSLAIIEYLDETHPEPPLLPATAADRARVRALADIVACDIHPINNLRVLRYLTHTYGRSEDDIGNWYNHWIDAGFDALGSVCSRPIRAPASFVMATGPASPTLRSRRRSSTPSATSSTCRPIRRSPGSLIAA